MIILKSAYDWNNKLVIIFWIHQFDNLLLYNLFSEMYVTLHLAFAAIIGFAVSEARQQEHDIGKYTINKLFISWCYMSYMNGRFAFYNGIYHPLSIWEYFYLSIS